MACAGLAIRIPLFLLAANHPQGLFAQGMGAAGADIEAFLFAILQLFAAEVEVADAAPLAVLLAGHLAIASEQLAQGLDHRLEIKAPGVAPASVDRRERAGSVERVGTLPAPIALAAIPLWILIARSPWSLCMVIAQDKASAW